MNEFSELSLPAILGSNLKRHNFVTPTPVQAQAIPPALEGRDVIATAQTGTGKTLAFVLPILNSILASNKKSGIDAIILSPTRELALQIRETFAKLAAGTGIRDAVVVGGMSESTQLRAIRGGARVLIATPGRLADYIERRLVNLTSVRMFVLDEADRMLDMGFLPVIRRIMGEIPKKRQTLLFSATIERSVAHLIQEHVTDPVRIAIGDTTRTADNVDLHAYEIDQDRKLALLVHLLNGGEGSCLVFARTRHGADRLAKQLSRCGVKSARIHGDRTQSQRNQALKSFQNGECRVLVATDVAARGIHVDGIAHVVNFDLPQAPEDFIHRVGRTGRAGARGVASTFATRSQRGELRRIEQALKLTLRRQTTPHVSMPEMEPEAAPRVIVLPSAAPVQRESMARPARRASFRPRGRR